MSSIWEVHVFWEYVKYLTNIFSMATDRGGDKETLGIGSLGAQYAYEAWIDIKGKRNYMAIYGWG